MEEIGLAESIIERKIGCGPFQILIVIFLFIFTKMSSLFIFIFMAFGNYNPGWRCLDNNTLSQNGINDSDTQLLNMSPANRSLEYSKDFTCEEFQACELVEFNPESITIVTEWGLVCDKAWISALMISLQMAGNLVGSFFSGHAADTFGRKKTLYGSLLVIIALTSTSIISTCWEIFASFRFLIGFVSAFFESLNYVYPAEFLSRRWRGPLMGIPGWAIGGITFGCVSMLLKNWKHVLLASSAVFIVCFLPVIWVPESLRWLEVKNKSKEFKIVAKKILKGRAVEPKQTTETLQKIDTANYTIIDLFRWGYWRVTIPISISWILISIIFYSTSFGVKALNGNFYLNIILLYTIQIPFTVFPLFGTNLFGRRGASCVFVLSSGLCFFAAMILDLFASGNDQMIPSLILFIVGLICVDTSWTAQQVHLTELYPTVVRGTAMNCANVMARIGGIIAPFLIPKDSHRIYVWYLIIGCLAVISFCLFTRLPETKGKSLKETFEKTGEIAVVVEENEEMEKMM